MKLELTREIFEKNIAIPNFMKIHPVAGEWLFSDRHDEANSRLSEFCEHATNYKVR
jgi:hypothetical protein